MNWTPFDPSWQQALPDIQWWQPGSQKYLNPWPKASNTSSKDYRFTYVWGAGRSFQSSGSLSPPAWKPVCPWDLFRTSRAMALLQQYASGFKRRPTERLMSKQSWAVHPWGYTHPKVGRISGKYQEYVEVLSYIMFYLLQDGCRPIDLESKLSHAPEIWKARAVRVSISAAFKTRCIVLLVLLGSFQKSGAPL